MSRTVIDLDDELLADVAQALGTGTKKESVNTALREVLENRRRALGLTRLRAAGCGLRRAKEASTWSSSRTRGTTGGECGAVPDRHQCARPLPPRRRRKYGWDQAASAGLIATYPVTELEFFYSVRSAADRARGIGELQSLLGWGPVDDRGTIALGRFRSC